jgi:hypothetical protein
MECGRRNRQSRGILDRRSAVISSDALGPPNILPQSTGNAHRVTVPAESLTIAQSGQISSSSFGSGRARNVSVDLTGSQPGALLILTNGSVPASTSDAGGAGSVFVGVADASTIDGTGNGAILPAQSFSAYVEGGLIISAGPITVINTGSIGPFSTVRAFVPSLSNPVQAIRTRQPLPRSPPTSVLTTPSTPTSIRSRRYRRDPTNCTGVLSYSARLAFRAATGLLEPRRGRPGELAQDPEASLPGLYTAGRDLNTNASPGAGPIEADNSVVQTTAPPDDALRQLNR